MQVVFLFIHLYHFSKASFRPMANPLNVNRIKYIPESHVLPFWSLPSQIIW